MNAGMKFIITMVNIDFDAMVSCQPDVRTSVFYEAVDKFYTGPIQNLNIVLYDISLSS